MVLGVLSSQYVTLSYKGPAEKARSVNTVSHKLYYYPENHTKDVPWKLHTYVYTGMEPYQ